MKNKTTEGLYNRWVKKIIRTRLTARKRADYKRQIKALKGLTQTQKVMLLLVLKSE